MTILTDIGPILLQADAGGLVGISLPKYFPRATAVTASRMPDNSVLKKTNRQIKEYLQGKRTAFDLPLHVCGTDFQKKVWKIISEIPYGHTLSYGEIAGRLGNKGKARAVGGAAHANPLPLVIPCHRVIGTDGSLTGFGAGLELKNKLLQLEQRI